MKIAKTGYWIGDTSNHHAYDEALSKELCQMLQAQTVYDFGCGQGKYVKALNELSICLGFDGNTQADNCFERDLTLPFAITQKADYILCLEVGEHIPKEHTKQFIENIKQNCTKGIILSWAIPGQGGDGHVNELPNEEVKAMFSEYEYDELATNKLRQSATLWWFKNTIMVFRNGKNE